MKRPFTAIRHWWGRNGDHLPDDRKVALQHSPSTDAPPPASGPEQEPRREPRPAPSLDRGSKPSPLDSVGIPPTLSYPATTLGRVLDQSADRYGDLVAVIYEQKQFTYRQLLALVNRMAGGLASLGVRRGDRVLLALPNCPEFIITFMAIQKLGAVCVNVGPLMGADDVQAAITLTTPRVAIGLDLQAAMLCECGRDSSIDAWVWVSLQEYQPVLKRLGYQFKRWHNREKHRGHAEHVDLDDLMKRAPSRPPTVEPRQDQVALLQPTGGTTGTLRLAQLTHRNLLANVMQVTMFAGSQPGQERIIALLPMFHVYGLTLCMLAPLFWPATLLLMTRFAVDSALQLWRTHKPTIFPLVPAICSAISDTVEAEGEHRQPLPPLRLCLSGAAPLPLEVAQRFERVTGVTAVEGYGLTEASPVTHANIPGRGRLGSIGLALPDTRVRVVDLETGKDAAAGQPGEMLVSGPQVMRGYFGNPELTRRALSTDPDGTTWLHTGDIVRVDADGYYYVMDRKKDMIIRSGMKVYPAKVERVLGSDTRVAEAAVVGRPDPIHTETVVAFVVLAAPVENQSALADELRTLCRQRLAPYEIPEEFHFLEKLPRSALGKLLKRELRERARTTATGATIDAPAGSDRAKEMK